MPPLPAAVGAEPEGGRGNEVENDKAEEPSAQGTKAAPIDDALNEEAPKEDALTPKEGTASALSDEEGTADALIAAEATKEEVTKAEAQNEEVAKAEAQNTSPNNDGGTEEEPTGPVGDAPGEPLPLRSARQEVNPDGTLRREPRTGPLAGLRERLGR
jgi:hypothetical protein